MSPAFRWALLWLAGSTLAVIAALTMLTAAHVDNEYLPSNADAFYHARRILDSLFSGQPVVQFDDKMHVPEGSWVTWPWGYDTVVTWITGMFGPFANEAAANRVLMHIPPAVLPIAIGVVIVIARQLKLSLSLTTVLVLAFATLPMIFILFSVGNIDHHFAELLWTLGTIAAGIAFFRAGSNRVLPGIVLGAVLGTAMAIHNGLFILQIPVSLALALTWLLGQPVPERRRMLAFAVSLIVVTTLVCIPSEPWRRGYFEFYTLSWFHFYIAVCVAAFSLLIAWFRRTPRAVVIVLVTAGLLVIPILGSLPLAGDFVSGQLESIRMIDEVHSPYALYFSSGAHFSTRLLSWLMWLSLPMLALNLWWLTSRKEPELVFVATVGVMGLALMQLQFRFGVFGVFSMLLTPLLFASLLAGRVAGFRKWATVACIALFAVCYYPTIANWQLHWTLAGNLAYRDIRSVFPKLHELCNQRPGIVLGDLDYGHWVRYHSSCSVIGNVFLLTPQHASKAFENARLLSLTPQALVADKTPVRYVFAHHTVNLKLDANGKESPDLEKLRLVLAPLERELLGPESKIPPQFEKRWEISTPAGQILGRLYEINRDE
jgi:hypothetical protein